MNGALGTISSSQSKFIIVPKQIRHKILIPKEVY